MTRIVVGQVQRGIFHVPWKLFIFMFVCFYLVVKLGGWMSSILTRGVPNSLYRNGHFTFSVLHCERKSSQKGLNQYSDYKLHVYLYPSQEKLCCVSGLMLFGSYIVRDRSSCLCRCLQVDIFVFCFSQIDYVLHFEKSYHAELSNTVDVA